MNGMASHTLNVDANHAPAQSAAKGRIVMTSSKILRFTLGSLYGARTFSHLRADPAAGHNFVCSKVAP